MAENTPPPSPSQGAQRLAALAQDFLKALALLTRLPVPPQLFEAAARWLGPPCAPAPAAAREGWAFPLVGLLIGALSALGAGLAMGLGMPAALAAAWALLLQAVLTGALHEDGLADTADALFGGWERARRLEILKDSHLGSYGVLALVLTALAKWAALAYLLEVGAWAALPVIAAVSRAPLAMMMAQMPNARGDGLSHETGRPSAQTAWSALAIGGAIALLLGTASGAVGAALGALCGAGAVAWLAHRRIGGQTGDILGAAQQMAELAALSALAAVL